MSMLPRPHPDATPDRSSSLAIAGHAIDGRWILLVMAGVGFGAGLAVSWLVGGQIAVEPSTADETGWPRPTAY